MKKIIATGLAIIMALTVFVAPTNEMKAEAKVSLNEGKVYTLNATRDFPRISISTPETTTRLYAGLTWQQLGLNIGVRLNVDEGEYGPAAQATVQNLVSSLGATMHCVLEMDLEAYVDSWCKDIETANSPIRVAFDLPKSWDTTRDYAVISVGANGVIEVLGDIDANPYSFTVDASNFGEFVFISAPMGTFNAYRKASPTALDNLAKPGFVKSLESTISADSECANIHDIGMLTDAQTVKNAMAKTKASLTISDVAPGPLARSAMESVIKQTSTMKYTFHDLELYSGSTRVEQTNQKLRLTVTVPYNFAAYADYAVVALDENGSAKLLRDLDANLHTITFDTDDFRSIAIVYGPKGAYDAFPY